MSWWPSSNRGASRGGVQRMSFGQFGAPASGSTKPSQNAQLNSTGVNMSRPDNPVTTPPPQQGMAGGMPPSIAGVPYTVNYLWNPGEGTRPGYGDIGTPDLPPPAPTGPVYTMPSERFPIDATRSGGATPGLPPGMPDPRWPVADTPPILPVRPGWGDIGAPDVPPPAPTGPVYTMPGIPDPMNPDRTGYDPRLDPRSQKAPRDQRFPDGGVRGKVPDMADMMESKAASGALTAADALEARRAGDEALATAILRAVAGFGWNYQRPDPRLPGSRMMMRPGAQRMSYSATGGNGIYT